ncbi:hypothetical protein OGATHE_006647 [Ogataea polymorpha]|uniref:Uncharacterized protein n=1 Tax=Ogataea polymorpha TaxID=460523 RepID=A0A9P8SXT1_9ASCO|nr:hypothetical protein OGATHE_006647 [Ogataea polymorpha]
MSDEKMAVGIALSVIGASIGRSAMTYLHARPLSFTISSPKNSPRRLAVVIDVDFWPPYSSSVFDMLRFSQISSIRSSSSSIWPRLSSTSSHRFAMLATACSNPFSSASEPSKLNTAYRFFRPLPSSFEVGNTIALYGPSTSKKIELSEIVSYLSRTGSTSIWYWWLVNRWCTR